MNKIFNFNRFGHYFLHDLRNASNNYLLSLLIVGAMPIIFFTFYQLFHLMINGSWAGDVSIANEVIALVVAVVIALFTFPVKVYGNITDKRYGSDWLMLPASSFEKFFSMLLVCCVVLPAILYGLLAASDGILTLLFPASYTHLNAAGAINSLFQEGGLQVNVQAVIYANWCENILAFVLGAICFKKSKVAKTFLCMMLLGVVMSIISSFFIRLGVVSDWIDDIQEGSLDNFTSAMNGFMNVVYVLYFVVLIGGLYYRIKTIKH